MKLIDKISEPGMPPKNNEDIWGISDTAAWVFDGATGLLPENMIAPDGMTDPRWLVERANEFLNNRADQINDIKTLYIDTQKYCEDAFNAGKRKDVKDSGEYPSAASIIVKHLGDKIICGSISDCTILIETDDGVDIVPPCPVHKAVDENSIKHMKVEISKGLSLKEARANVTPIILSQRKKANSPGGHSVFSLGTDLTDKVRVKEFSYSPNKHILMMTDGFYSIVEDYFQYDDAGLMKTAIEGGLKPIYNMIRDIEDKDPEGIKYTRMKKSDDATAILIKM